MSRYVKVKGERGLYQDPTSGVYYVRVQYGGRDTYKSLETNLKRKALEGLDARRQAKVAAKFGLALEPDEPARTATVAEIIKKFQEAGYPDKRGRKRQEGAYLRSQKDYCDTLLTFFRDGTVVDDLRPKLLSQYHEWRIGNVSRGTGHRTTDLELTTLSAALDWAVREELIEINPIKSRTRFHSSTEARHCRELAPADVDELHTISALLFKDRRREALGWQALFEGLTGLRTNEALSMRLDARPDEPGGLTADGGTLCVRRSKKAGRDNPYIEVHAGLKQLMEAHRDWHSKRFPESPWYFPGRHPKGAEPVTKGALTASLRGLFLSKKLKKQFTSHGMRAFYVLVRRSHGISDTQIAWEINHVGGVGTLEKVYGSAPPHWSKGGGPKLSWIPKGKPAWAHLKAARRKSRGGKAAVIPEAKKPLPSRAQRTIRRGWSRLDALGLLGRYGLNYANICLRIPVTRGTNRANRRTARQRDHPYAATRGGGEESC